jgi:CheY-like chemotaxis protein
VPATPVEMTRACRILLVDDDPMVAESTVAMLEDLGHCVVVASSGASALDLIHTESPVDLVITDHAMPGMTGMELVQHIRQARPDVPIILATGYAELSSGEDLGIPRLEKPYPMEKLASTIAAVVDRDIEPVPTRRP